MFCECESRWVALGWVIAAMAYGEMKERSEQETLVWNRLLLFDLGLIDPVPVALPELPRGASDHARSAGEGFALLLGLRWLDGNRRGTTYSLGFLAAWRQMSFWHAREARRELLAAGVIEQRGTERGRQIYLPGRLRESAAPCARSTPFAPYPAAERRDDLSQSGNQGWSVQPDPKTSVGGTPSSASSSSSGSGTPAASPGASKEKPRNSTASKRSGAERWTEDYATAEALRVRRKGLGP